MQLLLTKNNCLALGQFSVFSIKYIFINTKKRRNTMILAPNNFNKTLQGPHAVEEELAKELQRRKHEEESKRIQIERICANNEEIKGIK